MPRINVKTKILDAAERIVGTRGAGGLTLDAVAAEAGLSKGGLTYHFPSKEMLVTAVVQRLVDGFEARMAAARAGDVEPGAWTRGLLAACHPDAEERAATDQVCAALLASVAGDPQLLEPMRARQPDWKRALAADGIDPQVALIVRLALDGLWFNALLGIPLLDDEEQRALIDRLRAMTRSQTAAEPNATNERSATIGR
ncbi:MAG: TetR family transcriptional regulator [Alphaproteobacteria bacterium]|nr:TetR family transcriptional regulator [Alphaproteobacteria bacterium]